MAQFGRVALATCSAALSGSHIKAPGFAGGYLLFLLEVGAISRVIDTHCQDGRVNDFVTRAGLLRFKCAGPRAQRYSLAVHHGEVDARTAGVYWRADPEDMSILDGRDDRKRGELITERMRQWKSIKNA